MASEYGYLGEPYPARPRYIREYPSGDDFEPRPAPGRDRDFVREVDAASTGPGALVDEDRRRLDYFAAQGELGPDSKLRRYQARVIRSVVVGEDPFDMSREQERFADRIGNTVVDHSLEWMRDNGHPATEHEVRRYCGEVSASVRGALDELQADPGTTIPTPSGLIPDTPGQISLMALSSLEEMSRLYASGYGPEDEQWRRLGQLTGSMTELYRVKGRDLDFARELDGLGRDFEAELDMGPEPSVHNRFSPQEVWGAQAVLDNPEPAPLYEKADPPAPSDRSSIKDRLKAKMDSESARADQDQPDIAAGSGEVGLSLSERLGREGNALKQSRGDHGMSL